MTFLLDRSIKFEDGPIIDAFGRLRISAPFNLFDSQFQIDKRDPEWDELLVGAGTATHLPNEASIDMTVGTASGDKVVRQTRQYFRYEPSRSQAIAVTAVMDPSKVGCDQTVGYFDDDNGLFFRQKDNVFSVVRRTLTSGTPVDNEVAQSSWNLDTMDGAGPSGITIDTTKHQIYSIDLSWLGGGRVRMGFVVAGELIYCHEFLASNVLTTVYMTNPNLPIRFSIENTAVTSGATSIKQICISVVSEGGSEPKGLIRHGGNETTGVSVTTSVTPVVSIRLKAAYNRATLIPLIFDVINTSNNHVHYEIFIRGQLTGAVWNGISDAVELDTTATALTGGTEVFGGYVTNKERQAGGVFSLTDLVAAADIAGNTDIVTVTARSFSGVSNVLTAITWKEIF